MTTVLITGAASGIGAATAREAARRGYDVVLADIDLPAALALADELGQRAIGLDIRDETGWRRAFDANSIDVLINNAGIIHTGYARDLTVEQHRDVIEVNLLGTITGVLAALAHMTARGRGHIVNVCSMTSFLPLSGYATYGATKHGIRAFHHSIALEERGGPVTFSIVHPPSTRTPMLEREMADPSAVYRVRREVLLGGVRGQGDRGRRRAQAGRGGLPAAGRTPAAGRRGAAPADAVGHPDRGRFGP